MAVILSKDAYKGIMSCIRSELFGINSMSMHELAKLFDLSYDGDVNWEHGGTIYDASTWEQCGSVNAVRVDVTNRCVFIDIGSITKPRDMQAQLRSCGWTQEADGSISAQDGTILAEAGTSTLTHVQIHACNYAGELDTERCVVCPIIQSMDGDVFVDEGRRIPMDNLTGYVWHKYVVGHVFIVD